MTNLNDTLNFQSFNKIMKFDAEDSIVRIKRSSSDDDDDELYDKGFDAGYREGYSEYKEDLAKALETLLTQNQREYLTTLESLRETRSTRSPGDGWPRVWALDPTFLTDAVLVAFNMAIRDL